MVMLRENCDTSSVSPHIAIRIFDISSGDRLKRCCIPAHIVVVFLLVSRSTQGKMRCPFPHNVHRVSLMEITAYSPLQCSTNTKVSVNLSETWLCY